MNTSAEGTLLRYREMFGPLPPRVGLAMSLQTSVAGPLLEKLQAAVESGLPIRDWGELLNDLMETHSESETASRAMHIPPESPITEYGKKFEPVPLGIGRRVSANQLVKPFHAKLQAAIGSNQPIRDWAQLLRDLFAEAKVSTSPSTPHPRQSVTDQEMHE